MPHGHPELPAATQPLGSAADSWRLFFGVWLVLAFFLNPIPYSKAKGHIASTRIWLETGSFVIDGPERWGTVHDRRYDTELAGELGEYAVHQGRIYPKYPPGTNVLLAPLHALARPLARWIGPSPAYLPDERTDTVIVNCLGTLLLTAASVAFCGVLVWWTTGWMGHGEATRLGTTAVTVFGTLLFYHGTGLYTKPISGMMGFAALALVWSHRHRPRSPRTAALAGWLAGFAATVDYQAGITLVCVLAYAALVLPWRRSLLLAAVAAIPLAGLLAFHWRVLGHPLMTTYSYSLGHRTSFGLETLRWEPLVGLTVGFSRGVVWYMPVFVLGCVGLARAVLRRGPYRLEAALCATIVAGHFAFNLAATAWTSGPGFGPRYLVVAIPFAMVWFPGALAVIPRWCVLAVSALSVGVSYLGAQAYFIPDHASIPLRSAWQTFWTSGGASTRLWRWLAMQLGGGQWQGEGGLADPALWAVGVGHVLTFALLAAWIWFVARGLVPRRPSAAATPRA